MFKNVFSGSPLLITFEIISFVNSAAGLKSQFFLDVRDTAIAGMPRIVASNAAATVPEYEMSSHRFEPWFYARYHYVWFYR